MSAVEWEPEDARRRLLRGVALRRRATEIVNKDTELVMLAKARLSEATELLARIEDRPPDPR